MKNLKPYFYQEAHSSNNLEEVSSSHIYDRQKFIDSI